MKNSIGKYITAYNLRVLAFVAMIINHFGTFLCSYGSPMFKLQSIITRFAFVIFCFFLAEGMVHTHNRIKYLGRILLTAIVSEVFYDLHFLGSIPNWNGQNVCFTLFLGGLIIYINDLCKEKIENNILCVIVQILVTTILGYISSISFVDYGIMGIAVILEFYYLRNHKLIMVISVAFTFPILWGLQTCLYNVHRNIPNISLSLFLNNAKTELPGIVILPFLYCYEGKQGKKMPKWLVYGFYPIHLCIAWLLLRVICW